MSEGGKWYTLGLAILALVASVLYFALAVIPEFPTLTRADLNDFTIMLPLAYAALIFTLALLVMTIPPSGVVPLHAIRGVLEGALVAYAIISAFFLCQPEAWSDGTFRWIALYVGLLYTGPILSGLFAAAHVLYAALYVRQPDAKSKWNF